MDGLLLSGGADLDPARYGQPARGATDLEPDRDALEAEAWAVAKERAAPVLGICRGLQAINVFSGGSAPPARRWAHRGELGPRARQGPIRCGSRRAPGWPGFCSRPTRGGGVLEVNTYHHQGVRAADLAPGLVANAWASSPAGDLVEGLEAADGRFVIAVQSHPERTESTPPAFERLFAVFVDAARGPARRR